MHMNIDFVSDCEYASDSSYMLDHAACYKFHVYVCMISEKVSNQFSLNIFDW